MFDQSTATGSQTTGSDHSRSARVFLTGAWLGLFCSACIVEERKFDEDEAARHAGLTRADDSARSDDEQDEAVAEEAGAAATGPSAACTEYCDRVMSNCTDEFAVYASSDTCLAICALLPLEGDRDNSVACRSEEARLARSTGETDVHCPAAGPGGSTSRGARGCGTNCESYCLLQPLTCSGTNELVLEPAECLRRCAALPDEGAFDVTAHHDGDNVQCRLVHVSSAALGDTAAETHCWHAAIAPGVDGPCRTLDGIDPSCEHYCSIVNTACTGEFAVYENEAQCLAACGTMPPGAGGDTTQDTVGCRLYHSYSSLEGPAAHCAHAGPSGDGHCGEDNCASYCRLTEELCTEEFAAEYGSTGDCLADCAEMDGAAADSTYALETSAEGDTVQCRIRHAVLSADDDAACAAALGSSPCD
jgi:hypothetical protein